MMCGGMNDLNSLLWAHRYRLLLGALGLLLLAACGALYAALSGPVVQLLITGDSRVSEQLLGWLPWSLPVRDSSLSTLMHVALVLLVVALLKGAAHLGQALLLDGTAERVGCELRVHLFSHLLSLPLAAHRRHAVGDLLARLLEDVNRVKEAAVLAPVSLLREGLSAAALMIVAVWMAPWLSLAAAVAVPLVGIVIAALGRRIKRAAGAAQDHLGQLSARAAQALTALREVKSCGAEGREVDEVARQSGQNLRWSLRHIASRSVAPLFNETIAALALGLILILAGGYLAQGTLAPERFISFFTSVLLAYKPIKTMGRAAHQITAGRASLERVAVLLREPPESTGADLPALGGSMQLKRVGFSYGEGRAALEGINLTLEVGRVLAVTGPSGAGKSTLANLVCGLERPTSGEMTWDGEDLARHPLSALRARAALVPQQPLLLCGTLAENLRYGAPDAADEELQVAIAAAGLGEVVSGLERGLSTLIGPTGAGLSVGEIQRLAVVRAHLRRVELLVLDEPSSALDAANEAMLIETIRALGRTKAVLLIAHSESLLSAADQVIHLSRGRIEPGAATGSPS